MRHRKEARAPYMNVIVIRANPAKTTIALKPLEPTRSAKDLYEEDHYSLAIWRRQQQTRIRYAVTQNLT